MSARRFTFHGAPIATRIQGVKCSDCGMKLHDWREFHPYAACQVFKETHGSDKVWAAIRPMLDAGIAGPLAAAGSRVDTPGEGET